MELMKRIRHSLKKHVKSLGHKLSASQKRDLLERRNHLAVRISTFERKRSGFLLLDDDTRWSTGAGKVGDDVESSDWSDSDEDEIEQVVVHPEESQVTLPSALAPGEIQRLGITGIAEQEAQLRRGQINDALEGLRLAFGEKSLLFRTKVQNARSQRTTLRAWKDVNKQDADARRHKRVYDHARQALMRLDVDEEYLETLKDITREDMKMAGDVTEENRVGQRSSTLAWFWRLGGDPASEDAEINPRLKECKQTICTIGIQIAEENAVYRVNWLRAKARFKRWEEEHNLVKHEMVWTVRYFKYCQREWEGRRKRVDNDREGATGLMAYAAKQAALWGRFAEVGMTRFKREIWDLEFDL
jgi:hypothetical protein